MGAGRNTAKAFELTGPSVKSRRRTKWLGSASALAAAISAVSLASAIPAAAQSMSPVSAPVPESHQGGIGPSIRGVSVLGVTGQRNATPITSGGINRIPTPIATEPYVNARGITFDPPVVPSPNSPPATGPRPTTNPPVSGPNPSSTGASLAGPPIISMITTNSSTTAPSPGDTNTDGINVQATANYFSSDVDFRPGTSVDVVELLASEAIINWSTFSAGAAGSTVSFLSPTGNLEFTSDRSDYTVLNRIFTPGIDSAIRIDGNVTSNVLSGSGAGGNIWFYSPGGIIIGASASFDVGSLVLTSSDLSAILSGGNVMNFSGVATPDSAVIIEPGAVINASSYVALVAPRVEQGGDVNVDGSVAYVGAEQAQLTINNGLFDISVGLGSADANGVVHTGTTTGAASQAVINPSDNTVIDADARAIYMVAVPKNEAINMLVGGTIGYQPATMAARTSNGTIVLSAGADVTSNGDLASPVITIEKDAATDGGYIDFKGAFLTSNVDAYASDTIDLTQTGFDRLAASSDDRESYDVNIDANREIILGTSGLGKISIDGNLTLRTGDDVDGGSISLNFEQDAPVVDIVVGGGGGGPILVDTIGKDTIGKVFPAGDISIGGNLTADASYRGRDDFFIIRNNGNTGIGENATAGSIDFFIGANASVAVGGDLILDASAQGGKGEILNGNATAGSIGFSVNGGTLDVGGILSLDAGTQSASTGKIGGNGPGQEGSDGFGGDVSVDISGGQITAGELIINANGIGSTGRNSSIEQDNQGIAGAVTIDVGNAARATFGGIDISAIAFGADSYDDEGGEIDGTAMRGTAHISVMDAGTSFLVDNSLLINLQTNGIVAPPSDNVATIIVDRTGTGLFRVTDDIDISTSGTGGSFDAPTIAGSILVQATDGSISFGSLNLDANGRGRQSFNSGQDFQAGDITIQALTDGDISGGFAFINATASGVEGTGGDGVGGDIFLLADNGRLAFTDSVRVNASGEGGVGVESDAFDDFGVGQGGNVTFTVRGADGIMEFENVSAFANGSIFFDEESGSGSIEGDGGTGIGGNVTFNIENGTFSADDVNVTADGFGGQGGDVTDLLLLGGGEAEFDTGGKGGEGSGGTVIFNLTGGSATVIDLAITADGFGGRGALGSLNNDTLAGEGGNASGGTATFNANSGSLDVTNQLSVSARGIGGSGGSGSGVEGGTGADASGGDAVFNLLGSATISAATVLFRADASGGNGGTGFTTFDNESESSVPGQAGGDAGSATAGNAIFNNTSGDISFGTLTVSANGEGGNGGQSRGTGDNSAVNDGGAGGDGTGGTATINLNQDDLTDPIYIIEAMGIGGAGGRGLDSGSGGDAIGGSGRLNIGNVRINLTSVTIDASAIGGNAGLTDGVGGNGGDGGDGTAGSASFDINGDAAEFSSNSAMNLVADGIGGTGAAGNSPLSGPAAPGDGGNGGTGSGGLVSVQANGDAIVTYRIDSVVNARGFGGAGGNGGDAAVGTERSDGGNAGDGFGGQIALTANDGSSITVDGSGTTVTFDASALGGAGGDAGVSGDLQLGSAGGNGEATGGDIRITADGSSAVINFTGNLIADATAFGIEDFRVGAGGADATGGSVIIDVTNSGTLSIGGGLWIDVSAAAAVGEVSAGTASGGSVDLLMDGTDARFDILGEFSLFGGFPIRPRQNSLYIEASAYDAQTSNAAFFNATGGDTFGGTVNVDFQDGSSNFASALEFYNSSGVYTRTLGSNIGPDAINGGIATGGTISIALTDSTHNWGRTVASVETFGFGGEAIQGTIEMTLDNADLDITTPTGFGRLSLFTYTGGEITVNDPIAVQLAVLNGSTLGVERGILLFSDTGHGISGNTIHAGGVEMLVDASTVSANNIGLGNEAQPFRFPSITDNMTGADALAGDLTFTAQNGSVITGIVDFFSYAESASGANSGNVQSGTLTYVLDNSQHTGVGGRALSFFTDAEAHGGTDIGGTGGIATSGDVNVTITGASSFDGDIDIENLGFAYYVDSSHLGAMGDVNTGDVNFDILGGTVTIGTLNYVHTGDIEAGAAGTSGSDYNAGDFNLTVGAAADLTLGTLTVETSASGGAGGDAGGGAAGTGGTGTAGDVNLTVQSGATAAIIDATINATGTGGAGGGGDFFNDAGNGGTGQGGVVTIDVGGIGPVLTSLSSLSANASGVGGAGGAGIAGDTAIGGGIGGAGGAGVGGTATLAISGNGASLVVDPTLFTLIADGTGGAGGAGGSNASGGGTGDGGTGGDGTGGIVAIEANSGTTVTLNGGSGLFILASNGTGGRGGIGGDAGLSSGGVGALGGNGGTGTGGAPTLRATGGIIQGGDLQMTGVGFGGTGGSGGDDGNGTFSPDGDGGAGVGGSPLMQVLEGSPGIITFNNVDLLANGVGGTGTFVGAAFGGIVTINDLSTDPAGLITLGSLDVDASGSAAAFGTGFLMTGGSGPTTITTNLTVNSAGDIVYNFDGDGQLVVGGSTTLDTQGDILVTHINNTAAAISIDTTGNLSAQAQGSIDAQLGTILRGNEIFLNAGGNISANDLRAIPGIVISAGGNVLLNDAVATGPQGVSNIRGIRVTAGLDPFSTSAFDPLAEARITGTVDSYADVSITSGGNAVFAMGSSTVADDAISVRTGDDIIVETGASLISARNPSVATDPGEPFSGVAAITLEAGGLGVTGGTPIASLIVEGTVNANGDAIIATANAIDGLGGSFFGSSMSLDIADAPNTGVIQRDDNGLLSGSCLEGTICVGNIMADNVIAIGQNSNNDVISLVIEQAAVSANDILITIRDDIVMGTNGIPTQLSSTNQFLAESLTGDVDLRDAVITSDQITINAAGSLVGTGSLISTNNIAVDVGQDFNARLIDTDGALTNITPGFRYVVPGSIDIGTYRHGDSTIRINAGNDLSIGAIEIDGGTNRDILLTASDGGDGDVFLGTSAGVRSIVLIGDNIGFADLDATGVITLETLGTISGGSLISGSTMTLEGSSIDIGDITSGGTLDLEAVTGRITAADLISSGDMVVRTSDGATINDATTTNGKVQFLGDGDVLLGDITSAGLVGIFIDGDVQFSDIFAAGNSGVDVAGAFTGNSVEIGGAFDLTAARVDVATIIAGDEFAGTATVGSFNAGSVTATEITIISATDTIVGALDVDTSIEIVAASIQIGTATTNLSPFGLIDLSADDSIVAIGEINSAGRINISADTGFFIGTDIVGEADVSITAGTTVSFNDLTLIDGDFTAVAGDDIIFDTVNSSQLVDMQAGGLIDGGRIDAITSITLDAGQSIAIDHAEAGTDFTSTSFGNFTTGLNSIITGGDIVIAGDIVDLGNSSAGGLVDVTGTQIDYVTLLAGTTIDLVTQANTPQGVTGTGNGNITGVTTTAGPGASSLTALGSINLTGATIIGGSLVMDAGSNIAFNAADVLGGDFIASAGGGLSAGSIDGSGALRLVAQNDVLVSGDITTGDDVRIASILGSISGQEIDTSGSIGINANGTISFDNLTLAGGGVSISTGGDITLTNIIGSGAGGIGITSGAGGLSFIDFQSDGGVSLLAGIGALVGNDIDSGGQVAVDGDSVSLNEIVAAEDIFGISEVGAFILNSAITDQEIFIIAETLADLGPLDAGADITVEGGNIDLVQATAGNSILLTTGGTEGVLAGALTAGGDIEIESGSGGFAGSSLDAGDLINVTSINGGNISANGFAAGNAIVLNTDGSVTADSVEASHAGLGQVIINGGGGITIDSLTGNIADLDAMNAAISVAGNVDMTGLVTADAVSVLLRSDTDLIVGSSASGGNIDIEADGDLDIRGANAVGDITLVSGGSTSINAASATTNDGNIAITSDANVIVNSVVNAANELSIHSDALLDIQAAASGATVNVRADDITIGTSGALGRSDQTQLIDIQVDDDIYLGGPGGASSGFELDNDEFSRVHSGGDIDITATGDTNMVIDGLAVLVAAGNGAPADGNLGQGGTLSLHAGENVEVIGNATMSNATADNVFSIVAGETLSIDPNTGNLRVESGNAAITGSIDLTADSIIAISSSAENDIGGLSVADADIRLGQNDGDIREDGYLQSSSITFTVDDALLIQNSGAGTEFNDRRGFVADTVSINSTRPDVVIIINGIVAGEIGVSALPITGVPTGFDQASTINGCLIVDPASCVPVVIPPIETSDGRDDTPLQDLIDEQVEEESPVSDDVLSMVIEFREDPDQATDPLIDEPVTGAGNEDLWVNVEEECEDPTDVCEDEAELEPAE